MALIENSSFELVAEDLGYPESPKYLPDGSILLVEIKNEQLTRVAPDGTKTVVAKVPGGPNGLAIGPDGHAYIANNGGFTFLPVPLPNGQTLQIGTVQAPDYNGGSIDKVRLNKDFSSCDGSVEAVYTEVKKYMEFAELGTRHEAPSTFHDLGKKPVRLCGPDDLVFDAEGGMWITDWGKLRPREDGVKNRPRTADVTGIYYAGPNGGEIIETIFPVAAPNGIALSPLGDRIYTSLTYARQVQYWKLSKPGVIEPNPVTQDGSYLLTAKLPGQSILDSMTVDSAGNVYVAVMLPEGNTPWTNGGIAVISPDGNEVDFLEVKMPERFSPLPSSLCFGGDDLKTMYVTCGAAGTLLKCTVSVPGMHPNFYPYN